MSNATIYDVARESGFSIKTVSRVINGEPHVRPTTAARVRDAIERLGYHPNPAARRLGGAASDTIGVVVDSLKDPFFAEMISVIERRAREQEMDVLVASSHVDVDRAQTLIQRFVRRGIGGLIYAPLGDEEMSSSILPADLPTVIVDRQGGFADRDLVNVTDRLGAMDAVQHLIRYGHTRIAFLGMATYFSTVRERMAGYQAVLEMSDIAYDEDLVEPSCWTAEKAERLVRVMLALPDPPTAIFAASPIIGHGVLRAQRRLARQDLALVVFGDFPFAELMSPATTVVDQLPSQQGQTAMDLLLRRLETPERAPVQILLPTELKPRGSGELSPPGFEAP